MFMFSRLKVTALAISFAAALIAVPAQAEDHTAELEAKADAALVKLYEKSPKAKELAAVAKGVLVFPDIGKGGFIVAGQYGKGVLRQGGKSTGYFSSAQGSVGLQAGIQKFGYALVLMTDKAVKQLNAADGWELGTGPSIVVVEEGAAANLTTRTAKDDVYAFTFDQKGLMGGIGIQGTKITRLERP